MKNLNFSLSLFLFSLGLSQCGAIMSFPEDGVYSLFPNEDLRTGRRMNFFRFDDDGASSTRDRERTVDTVDFHRQRQPYPNPFHSFNYNSLTPNSGHHSRYPHKARVYFDDDRLVRFKPYSTRYDDFNRFENDVRGNNGGFLPSKDPNILYFGKSEAKLPPRKEFPTRFHIFDTQSRGKGENDQNTVFEEKQKQQKVTPYKVYNNDLPKEEGEKPFLNHDQYLDYHTKIALAKMDEKVDEEENEKPKIVYSRPANTGTGFNPLPNYSRDITSLFPITEDTSRLGKAVEEIQDTHPRPNQPSLEGGFLPIPAPHHFSRSDKVEFGNMRTSVSKSTSSTRVTSKESKKIKTNSKEDGKTKAEKLTGTTPTLLRPYEVEHGNDFTSDITTNSASTEDPVTVGPAGGVTPNTNDVPIEFSEDTQRTSTSDFVATDEEGYSSRKLETITLLPPDPVTFSIPFRGGGGVKGPVILESSESTFVTRNESSYSPVHRTGRDGNVIRVMRVKSEVRREAKKKGRRNNVDSAMSVYYEGNEEVTQESRSSSSAGIVSSVHAHISNCPKLQTQAEIICDVHIRDKHMNPTPQLMVGWRRKFHNETKPDVVVALNRSVVDAADFHDKFNVTLAPGISPMLRSVLLIREVTVPDTGTYQCEVSDGSTTLRSDTLLFLCH